MPNVREMKPVGSTNIATVQQQLKGGHQAQGFALAQTIIAATISTAQQLRRAVETAFDYDTSAREACVKALNDWRKEMTANAKNNGNLAAAGIDAKIAGSMARSAAVRVSEFSTIMQAMNNGFNADTLREKTGVDDIENVSFHVIVALAREFNRTGATRAGRPADPFEVKLAKWLKAQKVEGKDAEIKARVETMLADVLPKPEPEEESQAVPKETTATTRRVSDQVH